jgi:hypothetical protein
VDLSDPVLESFVMAPDDHVDIRIVDFYDRVPISLLQSASGRAAARRVLQWYGPVPTDVPKMLLLKRYEFVKCLEAIGATIMLPHLIGTNATTNISRFSMLVSPFSREISFAAMRERLVCQPVVRLDAETLETILLPRTIIELGTSAVVESLKGRPEEFKRKIKLKLKGTGYGNYRIDSGIARQIVNRCSELCVGELDRGG